MNEELVSIIVPIFNVGPYLKKCLDSIINQSYKNLEIILIDDGSSDGSEIICDKYKELDNRVVVIHKENEGLSSARNKGLDIASGHLISFVDSDDYIEPNMIELLKKNMDRYNSDIAICAFYQIKDGIRKSIGTDNEKQELFFTGKNKFVNTQNKLDSLTVYPWNKLYKKELFDGIRYQDGKIYESSYIMCNILDKSEKTSYILTPLYNYVFRKSSIVNSFSINHFDKIEAYNKNISFYTEKEYYDLALEEKNRKMNRIILNLSKMKRYNIINKEIYNKYYQELVDTNKEVKWKGSTKINRLYKVFRKSSINMIAFMMRIKDMIE